MSRTINLFDQIFIRIAQLSLLVMMLSISADALGRYAFNRPLQGSFEFTSLYLMVIVTFLAMPASYSAGGMVRLDILSAPLSRIPWHLSERINTFAGAAVFGFIAWHSGHEALEKFISRDTTFGVIQFPMYWSYVWVPLGCGLMAIRLTHEFVFPVIRPAHATEATE